MKVELALLLLITLVISQIVFSLYPGVQKDFFGAKVASEYIEHFDNKMKCAFVKGWHEDIKCMCLLTKEDERLGNSKTLIASERKACEDSDNEISPED